MKEKTKDELIKELEQELSILRKMLSLARRLIEIKDQKIKELSDGKEQR